MTLMLMAGAHSGVIASRSMVVGLPFPAETHIASHPVIPIHAAMLLHPSTHWPYRARGLWPASTLRFRYAHAASR
jgi:hypothetical protein